MPPPGDEQSALDFETAGPSGLDQWRASVRSAPAEEPLELSFTAGGEGVAAWREAQRDKIRDLARKEGLPIGEEVCVVLKSDIELIGRLSFDLSSGKLHVGSVTFLKAEIRSCARLS